MSALGWIAFTICSALVAAHWHTVGDGRFLIYALPGLALLVIIPFSLSAMSRRSYRNAGALYERAARSVALSTISPSMSGEAVKINGTVSKVSFRWLNRPHFIIEEGHHKIRVVMFTSPDENIAVGDRVNVLGLVMRNLFSRRSAVISAVRIGKNLS